MIEENRKIDEIESEIIVLENKMKREQQFNKKIEINNKINELRKKLEK